MFTVNYESWFVRKFLGYGEYSTLPNTICELGRVILGRAILFLMLATIGTVILGLYGTAVVGLLIVAFTDTTMAQFFDFGTEVATWTNVALMIFWLINVLGVIAGGIWFVSWFKERRQKNRYHAQQAYYQQHGEWPEDPKTPISDFAKGIWARIHDKTCALVKWENDPEERRIREDRERRERWERETAELVRLAEAAVTTDEQNQPENNA